MPSLKKLEAKTVNLISLSIQLFRYTFSKKKTIKSEELETMGVKMKKNGEVTLETEYEKVQKIDIENWDNVRGKSGS